MTYIFTISQKVEWIDYIQRSLHYDFYHTWTYHNLDKSGEPVLFVYEEDDIFIAFPLIKRKIKNSGFLDLTSVYGYSGPISNKKLEELPGKYLANFKHSFLDYLDKGKYVSVFSRLNPFFKQNQVMEMFGGIYDNGETVAIDLTISYEEQIAKYRKTLWASIKQLRRKGYCVKEGSSIGDIQAFIDIYIENMKRIGASDSYYFDKQYLTNFLLCKEFNSKLFLVYDGDEVICGSLISHTNGIIQGHLIATKSSYLNQSPSKLLVDEISIFGRKLNMKYYHLGGGLGFKRDSLFSWKEAFSDLFLPYYSWRYIANEPVYNSLLKKAKIENTSAIDFFPLYRYQVAAS